MKAGSSTLGLLFLSLFLDATTASCAHGTSLQKRKVTISKRQEGAAGGAANETVKKVEVKNFGYIGNIGPYVLLLHAIPTSLMSKNILDTRHGY